MAGQVNTFRTVTANITTSSAVVYEAPFGITSIILMAQVANITSNNHQVSFTHIADGERTELLKNYSVLKNDAATMLTGKLIIQQNNSVEIAASSNNALKLTMSVLETTNA
jgi:alkyl hydroperoxide reductase subunit AhpC